jgi:hypothetical protein
MSENDAREGKLESFGPLPFSQSSDEKLVLFAVPHI